MMVIRPARLDDLPALLQLAEAAGVGLTTLPDDERLLRKRITASIHALSSDVEQPAGQSYLFVMEDLLTGQVGGTAGLVARVGGYEPFFSYSIRKRVHTSERLNISNEVKALHLESSHKGPSEIGTLFLHPEARGSGNGRLLSLSRFLFVAAFRERFDTEIIAEMRGVSDDDGNSPFWDAVGRHFFQVGFADADAQSARDKAFVGEMMPRHPIYIPMLPPEVQAVVGRVHRQTVPALRLLEQEGFEYRDEVDVFDAGPMLRAHRDTIRSLTESKVAPLGRVVHDCQGETLMLVANDSLDFRCCLGQVDEEGDTVVLPRDVALAIGVRLGHSVRYVPARASTATVNEPTALPASSTASS